MIQQYVYNGKLVVKTGRTATKDQQSTNRRRSKNTFFTIYEIRYGEPDMDQKWREWVKEDELYVVDMNNVDEFVDLEQTPDDFDSILKSFLQPIDHN